MSLSGPSRPAAQPPGDVPALLRRLMDDDPGRPRLTWYGPGGERVELSAKVLDNWVAKIANLLVDELDAGPGTRVSIALPAHWRTVTWLLATWSVGACAVVGPRPDAQVLVSSDVATLAAPGHAARVAVALPALAASFGADLPGGALDAAIDVRSCGDVFVPFVRPAPSDPAFVPVPGTLLRHGELLETAARVADDAGFAPRVRVLTGAGPADAVRAVLAPLLRSGSVVLHHDLAALSPDELDRLRAQEGIGPPPA